MLSEPLAFSYAGWGAGTVLIVFYGFISCYTYVVSSITRTRSDVTRTEPKFLLE